MRIVRYIDEAREEFLHEVECFTAVSPRLGRRFDEAVQKAEALAAEFSDAGFPYKFGTRRVFPGKFKFSIVYVVRDDELVVLAVAPFRRKPGYWRSRLGAAHSG
ncbi:MAG: type II toxin-antitoxin system RelE/ParE family toxin [Ideonella sp.]|nr:type II toxin-antitoxin system RelE/ParE family toxin [Ideonella sp.]